MMVASSQGGLLTRDHVPDSSIESLKDFAPASTLWTDKENKWQNKIWKYGQQEQKLQKKSKQGIISYDKYEDKICHLAEKCEKKLEKAYNRHNSQWFENLDLASKVDVTASTTICDHLSNLFKCPTPAPTLAPTLSPTGGWFLGDAGASCVSVCAGVGAPCDVNRMNLVTSSEVMQVVVAESSKNAPSAITCFNGIQLNPESYDPSISQSGTCYLSGGFSSCDATFTFAQRFCCCSNDGANECPTTVA